MLKFFSIFGLVYFISACSDQNAALWHSLKSQDAYVHPDLDYVSPNDKMMTYEAYTKERQTLLKKQGNP